MRYLKTDKLYCFSPPIMLATFIIELMCALYVLWRYKLNPVTRPAVLILLFLATFQLAEYNVCEGAWGLDSLMWAKLGYVAITLLPPLGIHLAMRIAGQIRIWLLVAAYVAAAVFAVIFLGIGQGMSGQQCLGNYVIFDIAPWASLPYAMYYYGLLALGVSYSLKSAEMQKTNAKKKALYALAIGYLAFIVPTTTVNIIDPLTIAGIPSIMCGFAVILAIMVTFVVLPEYHKKR